MNTTEIRELNVAELDLVSGGKVFTRSIAGFTFTYDDKTRETTVSAGDVSVTTGPVSCRRRRRLRRTICRSRPASSRGCVTVTGPA